MGRWHHLSVHEKLDWLWFHVHKLLRVTDDFALRLIRIESLLNPKKGQATTITFLDTKGVPMNPLNMTDTQQAVVSLLITNAKGKPAAVDGVPVWVSADPTIISLVVAADGMSATAIAGNPGTTTVTVTADADLTAGVSPIIGILSCVVSAGGVATVVALSAATPTEQP